MRTIAEFIERGDDLPLLRFYIHNAPHRRAAEKHHKIIEQYRAELVSAAQASGIKIPITCPIALSVLFVDPSSPDLDNIVVALFRALDGTSHSRPTVLRDDSQIHMLEKVGKFYPGDEKK